MNIKRFGTIGLAVAVAGIGAWYFLVPKDNKMEVISQHTALLGDISNTTLVFGKAAPQEVFELSFDVSGKLTTYNPVEGDLISKGQTLAKLDSRTVRAQIGRANSAVNIERSRYQDLNASLSPEDLSVRQEEIQTQALTVEGARVDFANAIDGVLDDYRDLLDREIDRYYLYPTRSDTLLRLKEAEGMTDQSRDILSAKRVQLENTYLQLIDQVDIAIKYALVTGLFDSTTDLSGAISSQLDNESSLSARQVQDSLDDFNDNLDDLFDSLNSFSVQWNTAKSRMSFLEKQLLSLQSGADSSALQLQQSVINAKRTDLNALYTDLSKLTLKSPISGVVFDAPLVNYQTVSPGQIVASIVPDEPLVVKAQVAESDVQYIGPGNKAEVTFDALPGLVFDTQVTEVKNRENKNATVPTYETTFVFNADQDMSSVRSGMTANISVISGERQDVLAIPSNFISTKDGQNSVNIKVGDQFLEVIVESGIQTTSGQTEIRSGLNEGQTVYIIK